MAIANMPIYRQLFDFLCLASIAISAAEASGGTRGHAGRLRRLTNQASEWRPLAPVRGGPHSNHRRMVNAGPMGGPRPSNIKPATVRVQNRRYLRSASLGIGGFTSI